MACNIGYIPVLFDSMPTRPTGSGNPEATCLDVVIPFELTTTKTVDFDDADGNGTLNPSEVLTYTVTVRNDGPNVTPKCSGWPIGSTDASTSEWAWATDRRSSGPRAYTWPTASAKPPTPAPLSWTSPKSTSPSSNTAPPMARALSEIV